MLLCVGRRKDPIFGYVPKNFEKNNSGSKGLKGLIGNSLSFDAVESPL